jgi:flagellar hook-associated protein 1 FlgK
VGIAGSIRVNASVDPAQGGDPTRLRDGAISNPGNPAYVYNATGAAGFSDRLHQLFDALGAVQGFDAAAEIGTTATLANYAAASVGWVGQTRKSAAAEGDYRNAVLERTSNALTKAIGVNLDEEMTLLLELERSYQASTRLITAIDNMLGTLLQTAG